MDRLKRAALITRLVEKLREQDSWCGETHVQKSTFFLQTLMKVPLAFKFILYKHGPFSFDLKDELTGLRTDELIRLDPQWPYGPRIKTTDQGEYIQGLYPKTVEEYDSRIAFVAEQLSAKGVAELERLATALYVTKLPKTDASIDQRAKKLTDLKPHVAPTDAKAAVKEVDRIIEESRGHVH